MFIAAAIAATNGCPDNPKTAVSRQSSESAYTASLLTGMCQGSRQKRQLARHNALLSAHRLCCVVGGMSAQAPYPVVCVGDFTSLHRMKVYRNVQLGNHMSNPLRRSKDPTPRTPARPNRKRLVITNVQEIPVYLGDIYASPPSVSADFRLGGSATPPPHVPRSSERAE